METDLGSSKKSILRYICHQDPSRSFVINGKPMKICARCTGFYSGFLTGILIIIILIYSSPNFYLSSSQILVLLLIGLVPLAVDGFTQFIGLRESTNPVRLITGLNCGFWLATIIIWVINDIIT